MYTNTWDNYTNYTGCKIPAESPERIQVLNYGRLWEFTGTHNERLGLPFSLQIYMGVYRRIKRGLPRDCSGVPLTCSIKLVWEAYDYLDPLGRSTT